MSFRDLHRPGSPFVMPNAWDIGSARILAGLGAQAIGTTSAGYAQTRGTLDMGNITRDEMLAHCAEMSASVNVPVSGDLEDGYGPAPEDCADTVRLAAEAGLAGLCIEDVNSDAAPYDFDLAVDRMRAAASAARAQRRDMFLVARADGVMHGVYDLSEAIRRIQAFEAAGVDGIYVPMPGGKAKDMVALKQICASVTVPVNVLAAGPWMDEPLSGFADAGVARVSVGSALSRKIVGTLCAVGARVIEGDFSGLAGGASFATQDALLAKGAGDES